MVFISFVSIRPKSSNCNRNVVHYANTAHLIDMFTAAQIRNYRLRVYTDRYGYLSNDGTAVD